MIALRYESKSFRRTRGRSAGGTAGSDECAFGGACVLCGLFKTVEIAVNAVQDLNRAASVVVYHESRALNCSIRLAEHREQDSLWTYSECPKEMALVLVLAG